MAGVGHSLMFHTMTSLTLQTFPSQVRGTGSALALMMLDLGTIAGAPVLGMIGERFGFAVMFGSIGAFCFSSAMIYALSTLRFAAARSSDESAQVVLPTQMDVAARLNVAESVDSSRAGIRDA